MAAIAITLVDVVVYTPIAYMSGQTGAFFKQFGLTITAATLFSLAVSFTLTPMLASRMLKPVDPTSTPVGRPSLWVRFGRSWDECLAGLSSGYGRAVGWAVGRTRRRFLVVPVANLALVGSGALVPLGLIGSEFVPQSDQGLFYVNLEMPSGTSLEGTSAVLARVDTIVTTQKEVDQTLSLVASGGRDGGSQSRFGVIYVQLKPKAQRIRTDTEVAGAVQAIPSHREKSEDNRRATASVEGTK